MKKLILEEDINTSEESIDIISSSNLLSTLIKGEWDSVEMYNSILLTFQNENNEELANIIKDIITDKYIHIGQLEKSLQLVNSDAITIEDGKDEVIDIES